ncbi:hypothetical protein ACFV7Q_25640 [Streptomyces sp. NPDC059851]|uniref:COG1470 family protein n=1 Tax=Streptomyces sp. NPDC059851 TaxID=3346971 RepID=UPI00364FA54B
MPVLPTRRRGLIAPLTLAVAVLYTGPAAPAAAADEPDWTAAPAAGAAGSARPAFYLAGAPGAVLDDRLTLANPSDRERTLTLRGADAHQAPDGGFAVRPAGATTGAGSWISFGTAATVKIPARTRAVVPFTVTLPPSAQPGDHPAAVVAAEGGRDAAVRIHLRVGGPTLAALTVEDVSVRGRGAGAEVGYTLVNRGNVTLAPGLSLRAEGLFGTLPGRPHRALPVELLPGQRLRLSEPWPGAPLLDAVDLTLDVTAPGAAPASARASVRLAPRWAAAGTGGVLLALGAVTLTVLPRVRGRRTRRDGPGVAGEPVRGAGPTPDHELTRGATT